MKYHPSLHISVVTIEKGAFGSFSTIVANFTYIYIYIYIYIYWQHFFIETYLIEHNKKFFQHIFLLILSNCRFDFMIFGGY